PPSIYCPSSSLPLSLQTSKYAPSADCPICSRESRIPALKPSPNSISMEKPSAKPLCSLEALNLLNCITESPFDQDKCLRLLHSLRECVMSQKVKRFSLADQEQQEAKPSG
ncbi:Cysteine alpha-hairpin motif superfamily, partial [Quillaja saponaria]